MTLYTFYKDGDKVVYGTYAENSTRYFYSGFASKEEARKTVFDLLVKSKLEERKPNSHGISAPISMIETEVEMSLKGVWSEIQ